VEYQATTFRKIREDLQSRCASSTGVISLREFTPAARVLALPPPAIEGMLQWFEQTGGLYEDHCIPINRVAAYCAAAYLNIQFLPSRKNQLPSAPRE